MHDSYSKNRTHGCLNRSCNRGNGPRVRSSRNTTLEYTIPGAYAFTVILWRPHSNAEDSSHGIPGTWPGRRRLCGRSAAAVRSGRQHQSDSLTCRKGCRTVDDCPIIHPEGRVETTAGYGRPRSSFRVYDTSSCAHSNLSFGILKDVFEQLSLSKSTDTYRCHNKWL